jgi:hypothetical protein
MRRGGKNGKRKEGGKNGKRKEGGKNGKRKEGEKNTSWDSSLQGMGLREKTHYFRYNGSCGLFAGVFVYADDARAYLQNFANTDNA